MDMAGREDARHIFVTDMPPAGKEFPCRKFYYYRNRLEEFLKWTYVSVIRPI
jgi:hypothetical protein